MHAVDDLLCEKRNAEDIILYIIHVSIITNRSRRQTHAIPCQKPLPLMSHALRCPDCIYSMPVISSQR